MSRAMFFIALLILVTYFWFFRGFQKTIPGPTNVEQRYENAADDSATRGGN